MNFKAKLDQLRSARKLTYETLAEFLGHQDKGKVQGWLAPKPSHPRLEDALIVARKFGVPLEYLADDETKTIPGPPKLSRDRQDIEKLIEVLGESESLRRLKGSPGAMFPVS